MFGLWKSVDSTIHPSGISRDTITTPSYDLPAEVTVALEKTTSYNSQLQQYTVSGIFVYARSMRSYLPRLMTRISGGRPNPCPSCMLYVTKLSPMGRGSHHHEVAKCRQSLIGRIGQVTHMTIFPLYLRFISSPS